MSDKAKEKILEILDCGWLLEVLFISGKKTKNESPDKKVSLVVVEGVVLVVVT